MQKFKKLFNKTFENVGVFIKYMKENDYLYSHLIKKLKGFVDIEGDLKRRYENYKEMPWLGLASKEQSRIKSMLLEQNKKLILRVRRAIANKKGW